MSPLMIIRIMKFAVVAAEVAQVVWLAASILGKHKHGLKYHK